MPSTDLHAALTDLLSRVAELRGAILLDEDGIAIAQASQGLALDLEAIGADCSLLLRDTLAAAKRLGQGAVADVLLEAERATLAMIPLKDDCSLCLLLAPDAAVGRSLFEARRTAFALNQSL